MKPIGHLLNKESELKEIVGEIVDFDEKTTDYGSCMEIKIKEYDGILWWQEQSEKPMDLELGQFLKGFYKKESYEGTIICLEKYELLKDNLNAKV